MNSLPIQPEKSPRQCLLVLATVLLLAGCQNDPYLASHIEILNAEKRALEDQLYELEYDFERKLAELKEAQERLSQLDDQQTPTRSSRDTMTAPRVEMPADDDDFLDFNPPTVTPGVSDEPRIELPRPDRRSGSLRHNSSSEPTPTSLMLIEPDDPRITHIHINPSRTGGVDLDQMPGDDGITIVLEPRNKSDAFVPLAGPLSIVALDYAQRDAGSAARVARWELTAQQVERALRNQGSERGIYLRLPWTEQPPTNSKLLLAVRYTTADGRKLEARRDVFVTLPGQVSQRWTPRSSPADTGSDPQKGINVARQPSTTDGAQREPSPVLIEKFSTPASPLPEARQAGISVVAEAVTAPSWRPYR